MHTFEDYLKQIERELRRGDSTEHTHRPALKALVESATSGVVATNEPKREQCGAPDFIVTKSHVPLGYIETKDVGRPLDVAEKSEQILRYLPLGNLILTDYLEFRWYVGGKKRLTARLAAADSDGRVHVFTNGADDLAALLQQFLTSTAASVANPRQLAERMANLARVIRPRVAESLSAEDGDGPLKQVMDGFRKVLLHDLSEEQFADMYTQTLCYGLFTARCYHTGPDASTRRTAQYDMPRTNPFLRDLFSHFAGPELDDQPYAWAIDDLADILDRCDITGILEDFGKDPVVHFYETFLAAYDPKLREARGVYYTPEPVVSYIVRSVDHILKTDFGLPDGLADASKIKVKNRAGKDHEVHKVQILDPATGTGTFLHAVIDLIHESFAGNKGMWSGYVHDHLLPRLFGFELLMAPYAVAHLKLGLQIADTGYTFSPGERFGVFLTNTLEEAFKIEGLPFWGYRIAQEANEAGEVKLDAPVMVVLGNPPYSGHSVNRSWKMEEVAGKRGKHRVPTFIGGLLRDYFLVDGKPLGEKNPKWLNDDYVKFIRFAQWRIEQTGYGVLAFITNHGYLDNPTFRGMRQSLMRSFDRIYVYDLHGNIKKKETAPDGSKDENVFDIQQGVAICIMVKEKADRQDFAKVFHADLYGLREQKYRVLREGSVSSTDWNAITPVPPFGLFVPLNAACSAEYQQFAAINDILPTSSVGVVTGQDAHVIAYSYSDAVDLAVQHLVPREAVASIMYRPFDNRFIVYHGNVVTRTRQDVMRHLLGRRNISIVFMRQAALQGSYSHFLAAGTLVDNRAFYSNKGIMSLAPLYLYPDRATNGDLFSNGCARHPNLAPEFVTDIANKMGIEFVSDGKGDLTATFGPEDVFDYIYGVFHSPTYRSRYAEFLKIDFPRVPLTSDADLFRRLSALGGELVALHLMEKIGPNKPIFPIALPGDDPRQDRVEDVRYTDNGRVWINKLQYFEGVPKEIWEFHVGGYQVCQKWLKDRKGRLLSYDERMHYMGIVAALGETIRLMAEIDAAIDSHGGWPLT